MITTFKSRFLLLIFVFSFLTFFGIFNKAQAITQAPEFSVTSFNLSTDQNTITFTVAGNSGDAYSSCGSDINWDTFGNGYVGGPTITIPYVMSSGTISAGSASGSISSAEIIKLTDGQSGTPCDSSLRYSQAQESNVIPGTPGTFSVNNKTLNVSSLANGSYTLSVSLCATTGICDVATRAFVINNRVAGVTVTAKAVNPSGGSVLSPCTPNPVARGSSATCSQVNAASGYSTSQSVSITPAGCAAAGSFSGNTYTTGPLTSDTSVTACEIGFTFTQVGAVSGSHDGASGSVASSSCNAFGWAAFSTQQGTDLNIKILSDGVQVATDVADAYRGDLTGQCTGGTCAFNVDLSGLISSGVNHSITVQAQNPSTSAWTTISGSPKTLNCAAVVIPPCGNGANNPPTCTTFSDACGTSSGSTPRLTEPTTNPAACNPGTYANSPADTATVGAQAWNWSCGTVTSCTAPKFGCRTATDSNYSLPQYGLNGPNNNYGCAGTCSNGGSNYPTCTLPPGVMSGTLTTPNCTIASGASTCTTTVSWNVTNPTTVNGTSVTSTYPVPSTVVSPPVSSGTVDVGTKTNVTVPYNSRSFYLYNTGSQLASSTASAVCAVGTAWDGSKCAPAMTGTLTASNCTIASGASTCNSNLSWTTVNPVATSAVTTPTNITAGSGNNGSATYAVSGGNRTFYLYNNAQLLAQATAVASCISGTTWDGSKCAVNTPPPSSAPVVTIWASPSTGTVNVIKPTILWTVTNAPTSCTASLDWSGSKGASGTEQQPVLTTVKTYQYKLTCSNAVGSGSGTANVIVNATSSGVTISLNPTSIYAGDSSALTWSGPSACVGTNFNTGNAASGTISVSPSITTTYSVTCGGVSNQATLIVKKKPIFIEN
jgi:hypothetical protein